ncbi:sortase [Helicobacter pylori]|uniref:sortase n=1 Tax=Helicobacter pylori TaxID=210 RepID=UPI002F3555C8
MRSLSSIVGGLGLGVTIAAVVGYGVKKIIDAKSANDKAKDLKAKGPKAKDLLQNAKERLEKTRKRVKLAQSGCENALMGLGEKKLHVRNHGMSIFVEHFNQLKGHQFFVKASDTQDLHKQVSVAQNSSKQLVAPALANLRDLSAKNKKMEKKLEDVKAYCCEVEEAITKAYEVIDKLLAIKRVVELFTEQITKCDALFFSLSQDAIATMKKHNYDTSRYNQEERDQLCVTVSTLMTLSAFLKIPIIDKDQKPQEKAKRALNIMKGQMDALESGQESGCYNVAMIQSRQKDLENL